jgi:hypothetical protein
MAKASIVEIAPVKTNEKVVLELSIEEAALLCAVIGQVSSTYLIGTTLSRIYFSLKEIARVKNYTDKITKSFWCRIMAMFL